MFDKIIWLLTLRPGSWFRLTGTQQWCQSRRSHHCRLWRSRWHQGEEQIIFLSAWELSDVPGRKSSMQIIVEQLKIFSNWKQIFENHFGIWDFLLFCWKINLKKKTGKEILCQKCLCFKIYLPASLSLSCFWALSPGCIGCLEDWCRPTCEDWRQRIAVPTCTSQQVWNTSKQGSCWVT